jgi:acetyl esterase/lipase
MRRTRPLTLLLLLVLAVPVYSEPARVTRADLARSFMRFEQMYRAHRPVGERRAEVNRAFDRATFAFFRGGLAKVAWELEEITAGLRPAGLNTRARRVADALRVKIEPPVLVAGEDAVPVARVSLARLVRPGKTLYVLRIRTSDHVQDLSLGALTEKPVVLPLKLENREPGTRTLAIVLPDGTEVEAGRWYVSEKNLDLQRLANSRKLDAVSTKVPALVDAVGIARERNTLLRMRPSSTRTVEILLNPIELAASLEVEVAAILAGKDPYFRRAGHLWRELRVGRLRIPLRIYAPPAVRKGLPLPVVVALHGAGADENIFPEGYGAGEIVRQADEHGFILASPATGPFIMSPRSLGALLDALELHFAIDRRRVHVIGHSMGAMATIALAQRHPDLIAAACAMSGGGIISSRGKMAPTLFVTGDLDPIIRPARVKAAYERARKAEHPVEFRLATGYGHTLLVGDLLPECIAWLLKHAPTTTEEKAEPR